MKNPETIFKEKVARDLKTLKRIWFFKTQEVSVRGIPDYIICLNSMFVALELKASDKKHVDKLQEYNLNLIKNKGRGLAFEANPQNWEYLFSLLLKMDSNNESTL